MPQYIRPVGRQDMPADGVLVSQAIAGDEDAFETLVCRYHAQVFQFIRRYVRDYDEACDVFQQVLLKLFAHISTLCPGQEHLGPWLLRVARNCSIDELRRKHMVCFSELGWDADEDGESIPLASRADPGLSPEETVECQELRSMVFEAIDRLPVRLRDVVRLHYAHQLSFAEIGQQLHMPVSTVKSYFYRALSQLRVALVAEWQVDAPAAKRSRDRSLRKKA